MECGLRGADRRRTRRRNRRSAAAGRRGRFPEEGRPSARPGPAALRRALVMLHRVAGGMDDHRPARPQDLGQGVNPRGQVGRAARRIVAGVLVPHVADDQCGLHRIPLDGLFDHLVAARDFRNFLAAAGNQPDGLVPTGQGRLGRCQLVGSISGWACRGQKHCGNEKREGHVSHDADITRSRRRFQAYGGINPLCARIRGRRAAARGLATVGSAYH